jgi:hypothetical protein
MRAGMSHWQDTHERMADGYPLDERSADAGFHVGLDLVALARELVGVRHELEIVALLSIAPSVGPPEELAYMVTRCLQDQCRAAGTYGTRAAGEYATPRAVDTARRGEVRDDTRRTFQRKAGDQRRGPLVLQRAP